MKKIMLTLLFSSVFMVGLAGCDAVDKVTKGVDEATTSLPSTSSDTELDKYNSYVDFYNAMVGQTTTQDVMGEDYELYAFDEDGNPIAHTLDDDYSEPVYILGGVSDVELALTELEKYIEEKPKFDIDKTTKKLLPLVKEQIDMLNEISDYYTTKEYLNDNLEKGNQYAKDYLEIVNKVNETGETFSKEFDKMSDEHAAKERKDLEKSGDTARLALLDTIEKADDIYAFLNESVDVKEEIDPEYPEDITYTITIASDKLTELETIVSEFDKLVSACEELSEDEIEESGLSTVLSFNTSAKTLLNSTKTLVNVAKSNAIDEYAVTDVYDGYSSLISSYNSIV